MFGVGIKLVVLFTTLGRVVVSIVVHFTDQLHVSEVLDQYQISIEEMEKALLSISWSQWNT